MTLDGFELLQVRIFGEFRGILQILEAATVKLLEIDRYLQRQHCKHYVHSVATADFLGPSYTHCCRALTLALARLSCNLGFTTGTDLFTLLSWLLAPTSTEPPEFPRCAQNNTHKTIAVISSGICD